MFNKKQADKNNQNDNKATTQLWQTVSEQEQNALKGGFPKGFPPTWPCASITNNEILK
jgi:hypothetical protein